MKELGEMVTFDNKPIHPILPHINSLLQNAILSCKVSLEKYEGEFEKENIAPNQKLEHQWRFKQTSQPPGRKKKGHVLR